jgi:hypothetical protein
MDPERDVELRLLKDATVTPFAQSAFEPANREPMIRDGLAPARR